MQKKIFKYFSAIASALAFLKGSILVFRVLGAASSVNAVLTSLGLPHGSLELVEGWIDASVLYVMSLMEKIPEGISE